MDNEIIVIAGFSLSGKDSIANILRNYGYKFITSTTNRPMREGESEGDPYYFITRKEIEDMITNCEFIEYRVYDTINNGEPDRWYYAVSKKEINDIDKYVVVLDLQGAIDFQALFADRVKVFYIDVNEKERKRRAMNRLDFEEAEYNRRLKDDKEKFSQQLINNIADFTVQNYDLDECVQDILHKIKHGHQPHVEEII